MKKGIVGRVTKKNQMPGEATPKLRANFQIREEGAMWCGNAECVCARLVRQKQEIKALCEMRLWWIS